MNKKLLLIALICTGIFITGCSNNQTIKPVSTNKISQETTNTAGTAKDNTTNMVNSTSNNSTSQTAAISTSENNSTTAQNEESFFGQWVIEKVVGYSKAGTYSSDDIKKILGKNLSFSKEQSSCFGDDISYLNNTVKNPTYKKSVITSDEFTTGFRVPISTLTINSSTVTQIEINDEKNSPACTFFIKDDNTLILYGGGTFFELNRVSK
ncbi:hypothetical protein [Clostridium akagii]|uniref:hypothetical protein n=1 Tax=Clostridium akagii TaxID=91623 RepID=UPI00068B9BB9|nr:hypothetical protein [Clostridium akagii]